jgi:hypothetical protein
MHLISLIRSFRPLSKRLNSTQFFVVALLLFIATGVQTYYKNDKITPTVSPYYNETNVLFTMTRHLALAVNESLSPLMILACTVAMAGTLCRGLELVIQASTFKGR